MRPLAGTVLCTFLLVAGVPVTILGCDATSSDDEFGPADARELELVAVFAQADESMIRAREALEAGKLARMAASTTDWSRGTLPLYRHDVHDRTAPFEPSAFALDRLLVPSVGDAHVENFGTLRASDGTLALEPNDFDSAGRAPYLWDLRRLCVGVALAAALSNDDDAEARARVASVKRSVARRAAEGYRAAIDTIRSGGSIPRIDTPANNLILEDLFSRSRRDSVDRAELAELTRVDVPGAVRRLKRGAFDTDDPQHVLADLPPFARDALPETLARYRETLEGAPESRFFEILDAAREFGSGVSSWPRIRALVLVRGATDGPDDDVVLELKELGDTSVGGLYPSEVQTDAVGARILDATRTAWARRDASPLWGTSDWLGLPVQLREESEGQKTLRIARWVGDRGSPDVIGELAETLGRIVGRVHTAGDGGFDRAEAIGACIDRAPEVFLDEQANVGATYADLVLVDRERFVRALRRLGPRLGVPLDTADTPSAEFRAVLGSPPAANLP